MNELLAFFKPEAKKKNISLAITNSLPDEQANFKSDKGKIDSILTNLIKNALKFTHSGSIDFGYTLKERNKTIEIECYVKDTGIGIAKERHEAVFNRFEQADIEDKAAYQGSGLGLTISKAYVEMLGGQIVVESEPGKGSTFYFTIPRIEIQHTPENQHHPEITSSVENKHLNILIAEDDESIFQYLKIILGNKAKRIDHVLNGKEAIDFMKNTSDVQLILMDIQMPVLNGYEATKAIRTFDKKVIIIAQTAYALTGDKEKAIEAGCNDYISKPINKTELHTLIQKYFGYETMNRLHTEGYY